MPELILTSDGSHSLYSKQFGVSYHSKYGAIQETEHVFVKAGLEHLAKQQENIHILDIGFGTGLNAFLSFIAAEAKQLSVQYTAVEAYPIELNLAQQLNYSEQIDRPDLEKSFLQMHEIDWKLDFEPISPYFLLRKLKIPFEEIDLPNSIDVIYFDAFAPNAQPELWELPVLSRMYEALKTWRHINYLLR